MKMISLAYWINELNTAMFDILAILFTFRPGCAELSN
jgi:hypothetical protein